MADEKVLVEETALQHLQHGASGTGEHGDTKKRSERERRGYIRRFLAWDGCLVVTSMVGVVLGFAVGFTLYHTKASEDTILWIGLPGELYMRMLKAAVLPLIICSIITGTANLKPKDNGRVTAIALTYIIVTNAMGAVLGTLMAVIFRPGRTSAGPADADVTLETGNLQPADLFADLIRNLVPDNLVSACFQKSQTRYREKLSSSSGNETQYERYLGTSGGTNIVGLVIACTTIGMAAAHIGNEARTFLKFFRSATGVIMCLLNWIVMVTPVGAASLIAKSVGGSSDIENVFRGVGLFVLAESVGIILLAVVVIPLIYFVFIRRNPFRFLVSCARPVIAVLGPPSAAVGIPEFMTCLETRHDVDQRVSRFVVPLLASLNRDGSAMFIAVTSVYMAQTQDINTASSLLMITLLAAVGSLAVPAVPSSSVVTTLMVLDSLGISPATIGIIIALEWYSDRIRTSLNGVSIVLGGLVTWRLCRATLATSGSQQNSSNDLREEKNHVESTACPDNC